MSKKDGISDLWKALIGMPPETPDEEFRAEWDRRTSNVCKPCWELKYCPYGPLVEDFPLLPPTRDQATEHNEFIKKQLKEGTYDKSRQLAFEKQVAEFDASIYPEKNNPDDTAKACTVFGHMCPVFFVNEPFTETEELRRVGRNIARAVMLRVSRRDNNQCQVCSRVLLDSEIEFDHIIPVSKGGSSEEQNIRVTCIRCNREKSAHYAP